MFIIMKLCHDAKMFDEFLHTTYSGRSLLS